MNNSPKIQPTAIIVSMALTALAASYTDLTTTPVWEKVLDYLVLILAGTSTTQLYWSFIIPQIREEFHGSLTTIANSRSRFFIKLVTFYFSASTRLIIGQCTFNEMKLVGYLNSLVAFLILFLGHLLHIVYLGVQKN